ncbi:MAG: hypothetical protein K2H09_01360 [Treponemataceae bacterium]|nr:hypothetical protein [Treponemataceae bacterium]
MKWQDGRLQFEDGDTLRIEDGGSTGTFAARRGRDCGRCEFSSICDRRNRDNIMARFCTETHFERKRDRGGGKMTQNGRD